MAARKQLKQQHVNRFDTTVVSIAIVLLVFAYDFGLVQSTDINNSTVRVCAIGKSSASCCFNITQALELANNSLIQAILLEPGEHRLDSDTAYTSNILTGISLVGQSEDPRNVIVKCDSGFGFAFFNVTNLTVSNLSISGCGINTSRLNVIRQMSNNTLFSEISSVETDMATGIYIGSCQNVKLQNIIIQNTFGVGLLGINLLGKSILQQIRFRNNSVSGGAYLIYQDVSEHDKVHSDLEEHFIEIADCLFLANMDHQSFGTSPVTKNLQAARGSGGGLKIVMTQTSYTIRLLLQTCIFRDNVANYGAGALIGITTVSGGLISSGMVYANSITAHIIIRECQFFNNTAHNGSSALLVYKRDTCTNDLLEIDSCTFSNNNALSRYVRTTTLSPTIGSTVSIQFLNTSLSGQNYFIQNKGTAFEAVSCPVYIKGYTEVNQNKGTYGGGFRIFRSAYLVMCASSALNFTENTAFIAGGAIYVGLSIDSYPLEEATNDHCFLYFEKLDVGIGTCPNFQPSDITISLIDNRASIGHALYGSTLEACEWAQCAQDRIPQVEPLIYDTLLYLGVLDVPGFLVNDTLQGTGIVNSLINSICINSAGNITVMPGETFSLNVTTLDKFQQPVPSFLTLVDSGTEIYTTIAETGVWLGNGTGVISVISVTGQPNQTVPITLFAVDEHFSGFTTYAEVFISLVPCYPGFLFNISSNNCTCIRQLEDVGGFCDVHSGAISIPDSLWFGPVLCESDEELCFAYCHCVEGLCKSEHINIYNQDFDFQCASNHSRTGVACGACKTGYSASLGSNQCQQCTNFSLFLILLFAFTGVMTVLGMSLLRITITEGYLNSVLFFSNVVNLFAVYFTPLTTGKGAFIIAAWISQNVGISACFYNGMTTLSVFGLQYVYITYLFALVGCFGLIARYIQLPFTQEYAPSKVIATLFVILYASLLETSIGIMAFTRLTMLDGNILTRWYYDPNVAYFDGIHAFLCVLALFILLCFVIPFPFLLITPRLTYKIKYFNKLQPLFDAFWAPFKPKLRWWLSFRLLLRWASVMISSFVPTPYNIYGMETLLVIVLFIQSHLSPFSGRWQNIIDDTLVLILTLIFSGYVFFKGDDHELGLSIYCSLLTVLAYLLFIVVVVFHLFLRFPRCRPFLMNIPSFLKQRYNTGALNRLDVQEEDVTYSEVNVTPKERKQDMFSLARELNENQIEDIPNTGALRSTTVANRSKTSLAENTSESSSTFSLRNTNYVDFTVDREPLLSEDDNL